VTIHPVFKITFFGDISSFSVWLSGKCPLVMCWIHGNLILW